MTGFAVSLPSPLLVTGGWTPAVNAVLLKWDASPNPNLLHYEVRACIGTTYKVTNEFSVALLNPGILQWQGTVGVPSSGAKCVYRVYVILTTGNERGSNNLPVTRP